MSNAVATKKMTFRKSAHGVNMWQCYVGGAYASDIVIVRESLTLPRGDYRVEWKDWMGAKLVRSFRTLAEARAFAKDGQA